VYERNDRRDEIGAADRRTGISPTLIGVIALVVVAVIFILENQEETRISFLFWDARTDVWVAILIALIIGVLLGRLAGMLWRRRGRA
jgi:uncharacterized integral membrane protein